MEWYWWIVIYLVGSFFSTLGFTLFGNDDDGLKIFTALAWPIVIAFFIVCLPFAGIISACNYIAKRINRRYK